VIPWLLNFTCRHFGTLSLFHLHRSCEQEYTLAISSQLFFSFIRPMLMEQSVPKRRSIKFRSRGITQKKEYNIHNTTEVWNQDFPFCFNLVLLRDNHIHKNSSPDFIVSTFNSIHFLARCSYNNNNNNNNNNFALTDRLQASSLFWSLAHEVVYEILTVSCSPHIQPITPDSFHSPRQDGLSASGRNRIDCA